MLAVTTGCGDHLPSGASEDSITVMTWAPQGLKDTRGTNMAGMTAIAQVFAKNLNAHGGINGRALKVITCDEANSPRKAANCASRAIDEKAVAVVGSYSENGSSFMPALEGAGIPFIGGYGASDEEFTSPLSYPVNGGNATLLAGNGRQLVDYDCDRVSLVRPDSAAGDLLSSFLDAGLRAAHRPDATDVPAPEDATDYTKQATRAIDGDLPGSCLTVVLGKRTDTFLDSYRRIGTRNTKLGSVLGSIGQSLVASTGGAKGSLEGVYATGWYPPERDSRWDKMREVVQKYAFSNEEIDSGDPGEQTTWVAYKAFTAVARSLDADDISADSMRRALDRGKGVSTDGLTPPLSWRFEDMLSLRDHPRIVNTAVTYQKVDKGQLVALRKGFVDVRKTLERHDAATE